MPAVPGHASIDVGNNYLQVVIGSLLCIEQAFAVDCSLEQVRVPRCRRVAKGDGNLHQAAVISQQLALTPRVPQALCPFRRLTTDDEGGADGDERRLQITRRHELALGADHQA